jgi:hypothetical protein
MIKFCTLKLVHQTEDLHSARVAIVLDRLVLDVVGNVFAVGSVARKGL